MTIIKQINCRRAIIVAGSVLTAYLILILTVTNLGQHKLEESQRHSLGLKVRNYTDNLSFFFDANQQHLTNLAFNQATNTYFANKAAGMSVKYGLGSSLHNLQQTINTFMQSRKIGNQLIYNRIRVVGLGGTHIIDTGTSPDPDITVLQLDEMELKPQKISVIRTPDGPSIHLLRTIFHQNVPVAVLIAEINPEVLIHQLSTQEHADSQSCLSLVTPRGGLLVWNSLDQQQGFHSHHGDNAESQLIFLENTVAGTPFKLTSWHVPVNNQNIFTSTWFIGAISLLAAPVLAGLFYLVRVYNANMVLQTQIQVADGQQRRLADKNAQLSDEIDKRIASEAELAYLARHDDLTGLANRSAGMAVLLTTIEAAKTAGHGVLVMFLDLDNFKQVNDTIGHHAGDELLIQAAARLRHAMRKSDTIARFGGDEFILIIPGVLTQDAARVMARGILSLFDTPFTVEGREFFVSTSIGMALYPEHGDTPEKLLKKADAALYHAKEQGRNGYSFYSLHMKEDLQRKLDLNVRLHQAINHNELEVYYQPIVELTSGKWVGVEALVRWTDAQLGPVSPAEFIPLAEKNGLIHRLGDIVLTTACQDAASWQTISPLFVAVNFSCVQFRYAEQLQQRIMKVLASSGLAPDKLEMEVTESIFIEKDPALINCLNHLKSAGVKLSIDDFGTGYSALSYLQRFSFSKLKIDRSFINGMIDNHADLSLVNAMLAMAKSLNLRVVAEGIEEQAQADYLINAGCDYGQGYLFSRPLSADDFTAELQKRSPHWLTGGGMINGR